MDQVDIDLMNFLKSLPEEEFLRLKNEMLQMRYPFSSSIENESFEEQDMNGLLASAVNMKGSKGFWFSPYCKIYEIADDSSHVKFIADNLGLFGFSNDDYEKFKCSDDMEQVILENVLAKEWIRFRITDGVIFISYVDTPSQSKRFTSLFFQLTGDGVSLDTPVNLEIVNGSRFPCETIFLYDLLFK